jgi:hypothetical protein
MKRVILLLEVFAVALIFVGPRASSGIRAGLLLSAGCDQFGIVRAAPEPWSLTPPAQQGGHVAGEHQFGPNGGSASLDLAGPDSYGAQQCSWYAATRDSWIHVLGEGQTKNGSGDIIYSVDRNDFNNRTGSIEIVRNGDVERPIEWSIIQGPEFECLSPEELIFPQAGGRGLFSIGLFSVARFSTVYPSVSYGDVSSGDEVEWVHVASSQPAGSITYNVDAVNPVSTDQVYREARIYCYLDPGHTKSVCFGHVVTQLINTCPTTLICDALPDSRVCSLAQRGLPSALELSRSYRNNVLNNTERGRRYTQLYYKHSPEAVRIMLLHPSLMLRARDTLERYTPVLGSMTDGKAGVLTEGDLDEIDGLLKAFAEHGSRALKESLEGLRQDLRDPAAQRELNLSVRPGTKREMQ